MGLQANRETRRSLKKSKQRCKRKNKRIGMTCDEKKDLQIANKMKVKCYCKAGMKKFTLADMKYKEHLNIKNYIKKKKYK